MKFLGSFRLNVPSKTRPRYAAPTLFGFSSPCVTLEPMRLLSGPAGSAKTTHILDRFRQALRSGNSAIRLLVPTATMEYTLPAADGVFRRHTGDLSCYFLPVTVSPMTDGAVPVCTFTEVPGAANNFPD